MTYMTVRPNRSLFGSEMDHWFEDFFRAPKRSHRSEEGFAPRVNIDETKDDLKLMFELPGMEKDDIRVTLQDGVLTVSGKREYKCSSEEGGCVRREMRSGEFSRSFTLPETVNSDKISADYRRGILEIKLAKLEEVKPKEIEVKIS